MIPITTTTWKKLTTVRTLNGWTFVDEEFDMPKRSTYTVTAVDTKARTISLVQSLPDENRYYMLRVQNMPSNVHAITGVVVTWLKSSGIIMLAGYNIAHVFGEKQMRFYGQKWFNQAITEYWLK